MPPLTLVSTPLQIASGANNACAVTPDPVAPEFLVSLNTCTPPEKLQPWLEPSRIKSIETILAQIVSRLNGSFDPIWNGLDGRDPTWQPRAGCTQDENDRIQADEEWARWCTELMTATGYGGTPEYGAGIFTDIKFFRAFHDLPEERPPARGSTKPSPEELARPRNPVVPVKMACQQLCTFAYYSRGYSFSEVRGDGLTGCTASSNRHLRKLFEGDPDTTAWDKNKKYSVIKNGFGRAEGATKPGTILAFLPRAAAEGRVGGQPPGSHVVFVLRTAPSVSRAQFFDTGAAVEARQDRSKTGAKPAAAKYFNGGNYDNRLFEEDVNVRFVPDVQFVGIGVLKAEKSPAQIRAAIAEAKKARPLGFARLVILKRKPTGSYTEKEVLYLSPRVWLHDVTSDKNYHLSRLLWSLRATPGYESHEVLWQVSHPSDIPDTKDKKTGQVTKKGDPFATNAFRAMRTVPLREVWGSQPTRRNYSTFLTMSNETSKGGPAVLLHRTKGRPTDDGLDLVQEGDLSRYHAIVEYEYDEIKQVGGKKKKEHHAYRGMMATHPAGEHYLREDLARAPFAPPPYFRPW